MRRTGASLYLAVPSHSGGAPAVPLAHARAAVAFTPGARVTSIDGATAPKRASGLVPASQAQPHRLNAPSVAPHRCARTILPCRPTVAVLLPCLQRTRALLGQSREERVWSLSFAPLCTERTWGLAPASRSQRRRLTLASAEPCRQACSILPCRPTLAVLQPCHQQRTPALLWHSREECV